MRYHSVLPTNPTVKAAAAALATLLLWASAFPFIRVGLRSFGPVELAAQRFAVVGYATWRVAQADFGASRAAIFLYLAPPTATVLALGIAAEQPAPAVLLGGTLAITGVVFANSINR